MIPHPRRVYSCHGDGAKVLLSAQIACGLVHELQLRLRIIDGGAFKRDASHDWHRPLFTVETAPLAPDCAGLGSDPCDPPAAREPHSIQKDEPKPARCLRYIPRIEAAIATIDGLSGRLLRVSANGCGLMFAEVEVRHVNGGVAVLRVEFAWHHRVYASCSWVMPAPLAVTMAVGDALALAFAGGMDEDSEW